MLLISEDLHVLSANRAFLESFRLREEDVLGRDLQQLVRAERLVRGAREVLATGATQQAGLYELYVYARRDTKPARITMSAIHLADDEPPRLLLIVEDLTEEERLQAAHQESEQRYRDLIQGLDAIVWEADAHTLAFSFVSGRAETVLGYPVERWLREPDFWARRIPPGHPLRRNAEGIRDAAAQAAPLPRQLLAFSRKQVMAPRLVDLNGIVASIHAMLQRLLGETINLVTVTAPDLGGVKADPGQMEQMILNLCVNARDAMPDGGRLTVRTANVDLDEAAAARLSDARPGPYILLEVGDTGVGMDAETRSHLFEPFFTTKEQGKGTGLGLSTVYGTVKQSGGHIRVASEPRRGSTVTVYLPRVAAPVAPAERAAADAPAPRAGSSPEAVLTPGRGETILLVEDAQRVRAVVREILEMSNYVVLEARQGAEALEISNRHAGTIHLLVTDVVMPQMSGRELAQRLATLRPELKVLYMSGYTDDAIVRHGVLASGIAVLSKPFTPDALALKVREVLDGVADGAAAGPSIAPGGPSG